MKAKYTFSSFHNCSRDKYRSSTEFTHNMNISYVGLRTYICDGTFVIYISTLKFLNRSKHVYRDIITS